jgi:hypothetical protein
MVSSKQMNSRFLCCHSEAPTWLSLAIIAWGGKITDAIDGT